MSVLFCCEEENVRIDDEKGSPNSCITTTSSSSINTSPPTTTTTTAERFHMEPVGMDKKSVEELRRFNDEGSNDDGDDDDEAESQLNGSLGSMGSLEDALPVKRGLSRFFNGKSKSFANLMDAKTIEDLKKPEPLFNKRKRILRASKSYSAVQLLSMPEEEENTDQQEPQSEHETNKKIKTEKEMNLKI